MLTFPKAPSCTYQPAVRQELAIMVVTATGAGFTGAGAGAGAGVLGLDALDATGAVIFMELAIATDSVGDVVAEIA